MRNQRPIGPKVTGTTAIRNTVRVPLTTIILAGRSILLRQSKLRSFTESVPRWLNTTCNKVACATHSLIYWGPVNKIMPGWNLSPVRIRLPTPALSHKGVRTMLRPAYHGCENLAHMPNHEQTLLLLAKYVAENTRKCLQLLDQGSGISRARCGSFDDGIWLAWYFLNTIVTDETFSVSFLQSHQQHYAAPEIARST